MDDIIIIGGGGHAKVLINVLKRAGFYKVIGYTDQINRGTILGAPYLGKDAVLRELIEEKKKCNAAIGIGMVGQKEERKRIKILLETLDFDLPVIISNNANVGEEVNIGKATVVFDGVSINPGSDIGECCIINTNSTVEHDCRISDHVHISTGATLSGGVNIGENCFVGAGATVIQYINICADTLIGAGTTIIRDIDEPGVYVGNPARRVR